MNETLTGIAGLLRKGNMRKSFAVKGTIEKKSQVVKMQKSTGLSGISNTNHPCSQDSGNIEKKRKKYFKSQRTR